MRMFEMMAMLFYKNRITARKVWGFMEISFNPPISFSIFAFRAEFRRKKV